MFWVTNRYFKKEIVMNISKLKKEYENRITKICIWNKIKEPKYLKTIKYLTIFVGVIVLSAIIFSAVRFNNDITKQIKWMVCIILIELIYLLIIYLYLRRKPDRAINKKGVISTYDMERLKSLRRLFIKENICFDSIEKIQIIIDELICLKHQVIPFYDICKFIVNPLVIVFIPCLTVFLDHFTQPEDIRIQAAFLLLILMVIAIILSIFFMFVEPIRWLLYRKYDNFISDLRLLQLVDKKIYIN